MRPIARILVDARVLDEVVAARRTSVEFVYLGGNLAPGDTMKLSDCLRTVSTVVTAVVESPRRSSALEIALRGYDPLSVFGQRPRQLIATFEAREVVVDGAP